LRLWALYCIPEEWLSLINLFRSQGLWPREIPRDLPAAIAGQSPQNGPACATGLQGTFEDLSQKLCGLDSTSRTLPQQVNTPLHLEL
jgi:hypothetical protein